MNTWLLGSSTPTPRIGAITVGSDQVMPWSADRITASMLIGVMLLVIVIRSKASSTVPSGRTPITLPMVWASTPGSKIGRAGSHTPPVVRANQVGPVPIGLLGWVCPVSRSHTAYTRPGSIGSAVIASLSLNTSGSLSARSTVGSLHVSPPSLDRLATIALRGDIESNTSATWNTVPSAAIVTHGSVARS
jgi:hypothetical protein